MKKERKIIKMLLPSVCFFAAGAINVYIGGFSSNTLALIFGYLSIGAGLVFLFPLVLFQVNVFRHRKMKKESSDT